jgi:hypothetical protein
MTKTTTQNDLILYAYNEIGICDSDRIQRHIDGDPVVQQEFKEIIEMKDSLNVRLNPSAESVEKILAYSRSLKA